MNKSYLNEEICQNCAHRVKFNRRSGCTVKGVEKTIGCLDKACEYFKERRLQELGVEVD